MTSDPARAESCRTVGWRTDEGVDTAHSALRLMDESNPRTCHKRATHGRQTRVTSGPRRTTADRPFMGADQRFRANDRVRRPTSDTHETA